MIGLTSHPESTARIQHAYFKGNTLHAPTDTLVIRTARFMEALRSGNLNYFLQTLDLPYRSPGTDYSTPAKLLARVMLRNTQLNSSGRSRLTVSSIGVLYCCLVDVCTSPKSLGWLLAKHGIRTKKMRICSKVMVAVEIHWQPDDQTTRSLRERFPESQSPMPTDSTYFTSEHNPIPAETHDRSAFPTHDTLGGR